MILGMDLPCGAAALAVCLILASSQGHGASATTYHVSPGGSDSAAGTSPNSAWKTLDRASKAVLGPGDKLLLESGSRFVGELLINAAGTPGLPASVGKYGGKALPVVAGEGVPDSAVTARNPRHLIVEDLEITNELPGGKRRDNLRGITIRADGGGDFPDIALRRLHVHHVSGGWDRQGGQGIFCEAAGDNSKTGAKRSRFRGLVVDDCHVHDVSFYGICMSGWANRFRDERWYPSKGVRITNNLIHDTGGDAAVVICSEKTLMEHNEAYRASLGQMNGGRTPSGGIWPHSSDGTIIRFNKVAGIRGILDCQGYDVDINCRHTTVERNMSEDNSGGFALVCSIVGEAGPTRDIVVRENISIGDGHESGRILTVVGLVSGVTIENNVFVGTAGSKVNVLGGWESDEYPWAGQIALRRNLFFSEGEFRFDPGGMRDVKVEGNAYHGHFTGWPDDPGRVDVQLRGPDVLPDALPGLVHPELAKTGFKPFDLRQCGLTKSS